MGSTNPHYEADLTAIKYNTNKIIIRPRGLNIVWGKDGRYWNVPTQGSGVDKPAELLQVCWLEVTGFVDTNPDKNYEVTFRLSLTPDAFGWSGSTIYIMVKRGKDGEFESKKYDLTKYGTEEFNLTMKSTKSNQTDRKLYFGLYEVWSGKWKGGLKIHHVTVGEES
ncbi:hypothetical protein ACH5RR_040778 [Cinchona calisaya]|uniref:Protein PHLOEM PROTEIN 2-LIKE A9-like n=1 Tax=Cinchona calisaya TaxID=153742 RepID=A0ABD2XTQ3_9GENT